MTDTTTIWVRPIATHWVRAVQAGGPDAHGQAAERATSDGVGTPCRHCLHDVPAGRGLLVLAHRPFATAQPYAETGPIFLCADACPAWAGAGLPPILATSPDYLLRGYDARDRIAYGSGGVVAADALAARAAALLADPGIGYLHVRSARNSCYQARIERG